MSNQSKPGDQSAKPGHPINQLLAKYNQPCQLTSQAWLSTNLPTSQSYLRTIKAWPMNQQTNQQSLIRTMKV